MSDQRRRLVRMASSMNKRAVRSGGRGVVRWDELASLGDACHYCGISLEPLHGSYDHVVALDRGGPNVIANIVRCCMTCQRSKHTKSSEEFAEARALVMTCALPGCGVSWRPRYGEYKRGMARYHSLSCAAKSRWVHA